MELLLKKERATGGPANSTVGWLLAKF
jgi:hypothetical protein